LLPSGSGEHRTRSPARHSLQIGSQWPPRSLARRRAAVGLDWLDGMGDMNAVEFGKAEQGRAELEPFVHEAAAGPVDAAPEELATSCARSWHRRTPPSSPTSSPRSSRERCVEDWRTASRGGSTTTSPSRRIGDSSSARSSARAPLPTASTTDSFRPRTPLAQGWIPAVDARISEGDGQPRGALPEIQAWLLERLHPREAPEPRAT
jgi:hypothetical protein